MPEVSIDWRVVDRVWKSIESSDDPKLARKKNEVRGKYDEISKRPRRQGHELSSAGDAGRSPERQIAHASLQTVVDVFAFVASACQFYDTLQSCRQLTDAEKEIGEDLSSLLMQAQALVPKGPSRRDK